MWASSIKEDRRRWVLFLLIGLCFAFSLAVFWGVPPAADGYRYLSAARYVADTGNLLGEWPKTHINPASFGEPRLGIAIASFGYAMGGENGVKLLLAIFSALTVYPANRILRRFVGEGTAMLGTILWIFLPINFLWTSFFYIDSIAILFGLLGLWGLVKLVCEEDVSAKWTLITCVSFTLAVLSRRASIIYIYPIIMVLLFMFLRKREESRRLISISTVLAIFLLTSTIWTLGYVQSGIRENPDVEPSLYSLVDPSVWYNQAVGIFAQFNGFFAGEVASNWLDRYPSLFVIWLGSACLLSFSFFLGVLRLDKNARFWVVICIVAAIAQILYIQYSTSHTAMAHSLTRYFAYFSPLLALALAQAIICVGDRRRPIVRKGLTLAMLVSFVCVLSVGIINIQMRGHHLGQLIDLVEDGSRSLPVDKSVASNEPHSLYYTLYPRPVYNLGEYDLEELVDMNVTHMLLIDCPVPDQAIQMGFVEVWSKNRRLTGVTGATRGYTNLSVYRLETR